MSRPITELNTGDLVRIRIGDENYPFRVLVRKPGKYDVDGVALISAEIYTMLHVRVPDDQNDLYAIYREAPWREYLNTEFIEMLDEDIRLLLQAPKINGLFFNEELDQYDPIETCDKVFVPSAAEVTGLHKNIHEQSNQFVIDGENWNMLNGEGLASVSPYGYVTRTSFSTVEEGEEAYWLYHVDPLGDGGILQEQKMGINGKEDGNTRYRFFPLAPMVYISPNAKVTDELESYENKDWLDVTHQWQAYDFFINYPPTSPPELTVSEPVIGGDSLTITWEESTDPDGNLAGYILERSVDEGEFEMLYTGEERSFTDDITKGWISVQYRVKAFDTEDEESEYTTSTLLEVDNNDPPTEPAFLTVPEEVFGNQELTITWGEATDPDDNLAGYVLERAIEEGGEFTELYSGDELTFTDFIVKWTPVVQYRVKAFDAKGLESDYLTSELRNVDNNTPPVIDCATSGDLGNKEAGFSIDYVVTDEEDDQVTVVETIDGKEHNRYIAALGETNTFYVTGNDFVKLLNGAHTLEITATDPDGKEDNLILTFTKALYRCTIEPAIPLPADGPITKMVMTVVRDLPDDANFKVEASNNAKDAHIVWEDVTNAVHMRANYIFTNKTLEATPAFSFRITASRGESEGEFNISAIEGAFE